MLRINVNNQRIVLAHLQDGIYAMEDRCSHEDASLYNGALKGDCVECPLHGSRFNFKTGQPQEEPATEAIQTYPVTIKDDSIYLAL